MTVDVQALQELWRGETPHSPPIRDGFLGLELRMASSPAGRTTVAHTSFAGGPPLLVAVDLSSGRVFQRRADRRPQTSPPPPAGQVNVDLLRFLALPPARADYAVFLWHRRLVSRVVCCEAYGDELEPEEPPGLAFARSPRAQERREATVELASAGAALEGRVSAGATRVLGCRPAVATVLALHEGTDRLVWRCQTLPESCWQVPELSFRLEPSRFLPAEWLQPAGSTTHFIVLLRGIRSGVLSVKLAEEGETWVTST